MGPGRGGRLLALAYALGVAALVLTPIGWLLNRLTVQVYVLLAYHLHIPGVLPEHVGHALNVLLFIPAGWLLQQLLRRHWSIATLAAGLASLAFELTQALPVIGREPSVLDVATNTAGALIGALACRVRTRRRRGAAAAEVPRRSDDPPTLRA